MKRLLYIYLFIFSFSVLGFSHNNRWYCPEDIHDEYWNFIDSMLPDSVRFYDQIIPIKEKLTAIKDLNALDSLMNTFYTNYHNGSIRVDKYNKNMYISRYIFPAYIVKSLADCLGYEIGVIHHGTFSVDRIEKLFEWYKYNKGKIDIKDLIRLTSSEFICDFVTDFYYTCSELYEIRNQIQGIECFDPMKNWITSMSNEDKILMDSLFELYPDKKSLKLKLLNDKLECFSVFHHYTLINDSVAKKDFDREDI